MKPIRKPSLCVVLVGCGAVSQLFYAPALMALVEVGQLSVVAVVDPDFSARNAMQCHFPSVVSVDQIGAVPGDVAPDGSLCIVAAPPRFHYAVTIAALARGWNVLCEKPMASNVEESEAMISAATAAKRILAVGHYKRFMPAHQAIKRFIEKHTFGHLCEIQIAEGGKFTWPAVSDSFFRKEQTGGGVLLDTGVHVLDLLLWWMGEPIEFQYSDDARDGVEANCILTAKFDRNSTNLGPPVHVRVRLSRDWTTQNCYSFRFEHATIQCRVNASNQLELSLDDLPMTLAGELRAPPKCRFATATKSLETNSQAFIAQLNDVCSAVREGRPPFVTGIDGMRSVSWIQQCYANKSEIVEEWSQAVSLRDDSVKTGTHNKQRLGDQLRRTPVGESLPTVVAIIGASGFVGLRATELLSSNSEWNVRPIVRASSSLAVLARQQFDWRIADFLSAKTLTSALKGCSVCVHAAIGDPGQIVKMAEVTYKACVFAGVKRLVWLSSASVHGQNPRIGTDESTQLSDDQQLCYNNAKVRAEWELERLSRDGKVEVVRLRPSIVFGPRSRWISEPALALQAGTASWINKGAAICNTVYIDNLVSAIAISAQHTQAAGHAFLVGDDAQISWRDYLLSIATHLSLDETEFANMPIPVVVREQGDLSAAITMSSAYAMCAKYIPDRAKRVVKGVLKSWREPMPVQSGWTLRDPNKSPKLDAEMALLLQCEWSLPWTKAREQLGYTPLVSFSEGMRRSLRWLDSLG